MALRDFTLALLAGAMVVPLSGCANGLVRHPVGNAAVPAPAKAVDLQRYTGLWYEQARYEQTFQKDCDGVTAEYRQREDGLIDVINRCRKPDGRMTASEGKARVVPGSANAQLKVSFFGPFWGDYWVLDHADDYSWSIVGEQSGRYLWLLTRDAVPGDDTVGSLYARAAALGYDTAMLRRTKQP